MELINIYAGSYIHTHYGLLYNLMGERKDYHSISHNQMPTFPEHVKFIDSRPYQFWYGIWNDKDFIGSIYIGKENNIGLFIKKEYQHKGYGKKALQEIMKLHPLPYYLANINPNNSGSIAFFSNFGFKYLHALAEIGDPNEVQDGSMEIYKIIQYTYKFTPSDEKV